MDELFYEMIFKRKSFHRMKDYQPLEANEIADIYHYLHQLQPLTDDIRVEFRIVPRRQTTCRQGEYCILIYSEVKEHYLLNAGYLGEQLDLWLAARNIGVCWYGMAKPAVTQYHGLEFVIMLTIAKAAPEDFRRDYTKAKRKPLAEIWTGAAHPALAEAVRYAPSACNSQPWLVRAAADRLELCRVPAKRGIIPRAKMAYYNGIDMGIFLLFLEICLQHQQQGYQRQLAPEDGTDNQPILTAVYQLEATATPQG